MPRKIDPGTVKSGSGRKAAGTGANLVLTGATGAPPNVGVPGWVPPGDVLANALPLTQDIRFEAGGGGLTGLYGHTEEAGAHTAAGISQNDGNGPLLAGNVQGALNELGGMLPPEPPKLGQTASFTLFSGITDWGALKLNDSSLVDRGLVTSTNTPTGIFPYYFVAPTPQVSPGTYNPAGADPATDPVWNTGLLALPGAGIGQTYAGGFTRDGTAAGQNVMLTARVMQRPGARQEVTISGTLYPADRGVLALVHWPAGVLAAAPTVNDFLNQAILDRCFAAILLGQGVNHASGNGPCVGVTPCDTQACDGAPGGIFGAGASAGKFDPYAFPGKATGQYDLKEIFTGLSDIDGSPLKAPFNDLDGDLNAGAQRLVNSTVPGPGQVRLGTDPNAGIPNLPYGIPILGGSLEGYDQATPPPTVINGQKAIGNSQIRSSNFFRYRLPYLQSYTATGLKWTPSGVDPAASKEKARYFTVAAPAAPGTVAPLGTAGNYTGFAEDYWNWQIARYRHNFLLPTPAGGGNRLECGTYWLIHFKTEANFESFVRDGVMPWTPGSEYEVYGASLVDTTGIEHSGNYVNEETSSTVASPHGPAPTYGFAADSYHQIRGLVFQDPTPVFMPSFTSTFNWDVAAASCTMLVSGVSYFTARKVTDGTTSFRFTDLNVDSDNPHGFWKASYRTDDSTLTNDTTAPALLSSPCPVFLGIAPFAYGMNPAQLDDPSLLVDEGLAGAALTDFTGGRSQRIEIPFTHCGSNGGGVFGTANGPRDVDPLSLNLFNPMACLGDATTPSFTRDAKLRAYFRRPFGHHTAADAILPFSAFDGHGIVVPPVDGATILYHSTSFDTAHLVGQFGNFRTAGAVPTIAYAVLNTSTKDTQEFFLDEVYRWVPIWDAGIGVAPYDANAVAALAGPGMGAWAPSPIEVPVRAGRSPAPWNAASWVQNDLHKVTLDIADPRTETGLQVSGLPDRNPPVTDGAKFPFPSAGILMYPQKDYTLAAIRPSQIADGILAQPNYSALVGLREYVRAFDAGFLNSGTPVAADGQPFLTLRFDGVTLSDFAFAAPGPGRVENNALAIMVKVPGLTTWMDAGRPDGAGPGKQDPVLDGAGCMVVGPQTADGTDPETGLKFCTVRVHVGPVANLFKSTGILGVPVGEVPVLVKVMMRETAADYALEKQFIGGAFGAVEVGVTSSQVRGLVGMRVVRPA